MLFGKNSISYKFVSIEIQEFAVHDKSIYRLFLYQIMIKLIGVYLDIGYFYDISCLFDLRSLLVTSSCVKGSVDVVNCKVNVL